MSHSHLIVGHITDTSVKIWVRAGNEIEFITPANIHIDVSDDSTEEVVYSDSYEFIDDSTFGCHVFDIHGLNQQSDNFKPYKVKAIVTLSNGVTHDLSGKFRTAPVNTTKFSFFLGSCYFSQGKDYFSPEYKDLKKWADIKKPVFMMNCGDQIYIDVVQGGWVSRSKEDYIDRHLDTWYAKDTRKFLSTLPQYMILDDHELYNNFKLPNPSNEKRMNTFNNAKSIYKHFQHSHNPDTTPDNRFYYHYDIGNVSYFVFDVRTEKTSSTMISNDQLIAFREWVNSNTGKMKFIVTPVPIITQLTAGQQKDKWSGEHYRSQRDEVFEVLVNAGCKKFIFLTGDIHLACHAKLSFVCDGSEWVFHELTSSPIKQLQFWIVNRMVKKIKNNTINNVTTEYDYKLVRYMGKKNNAHGADNFSLQNNAMNITWDPEENKVVYESLALNSKDLTRIFHGEVEMP